MAALAVSGALQAGAITFSVTNDAPANGMWIMRPWVGVSDANFTTFTVGSAASPPAQHEAEDGVTGDPANTLAPSNACTAGAPGETGSDCLYQSFNGYANGTSQVSIGNPTAPGATISGTLATTPGAADSQYLSYLIMAIPSNDTFFGSPTSTPVQLYDNSGNFLGTGPNDDITITVYSNETVLTDLLGTFTYTAAEGGGLMDAGTEQNLGCPNGSGSSDGVAFLCQGPAGQGTHTGVSGMVEPDITPFVSSIVNGSNVFGGATNTFTNINDSFTNPGDPIATIQISAAPEPASVALFGSALGILGLVALRRRRISG
jgi:hypothetical protein